MTTTQAVSLQAVSPEILAKYRAFREETPPPPENRSTLWPYVVPLAEMRALGYSSKEIFAFLTQAGVKLSYSLVCRWLNAEVGTSSGPGSQAASIVEKAVRQGVFSSAHVGEDGKFNGGPVKTKKVPKVKQTTVVAATPTTQGAATTVPTSIKEPPAAPAPTPAKPPAPSPDALAAEAERLRTKKIIADGIAALENESFGAMARAGLVMDPKNFTK